MEPFFHLIIPFIILLAIFPKINKKYAILLLPLTFIMDFDLFIPTTHRIIFHNIFFIIIITALLSLILNKEATLIALYYLTSHIILDLNYFGSAFLYPLYKKAIGINIELLRHQGQWLPKLKFILTPLDKIPIDYPSRYLTTDGFLLILLLTITIIISIIINKKN